MPFSCGEVNNFWKWNFNWFFCQFSKKINILIIWPEFTVSPGEHFFVTFTPLSVYFRANTISWHFIYKIFHKMCKKTICKLKKRFLKLISKNFQNKFSFTSLYINIFLDYHTNKIWFEFLNSQIDFYKMQSPRNKRKQTRKTLEQNPNQLSLDFIRQESEIEIHLPKQEIKFNSSSMPYTRRAMITLSVG